MAPTNLLTSALGDAAVSEVGDSAFVDRCTPYLVLTKVEEVVSMGELAFAEKLVDETIVVDGGDALSGDRKNTRHTGLNTAHGYGEVAAMVMGTKIETGKTVIVTNDVIDGEILS